MCSAAMKKKLKTLKTDVVPIWVNKLALLKKKSELLWERNKINKKILFLSEYPTKVIASKIARGLCGKKGKTIYQKNRNKMEPRGQK